MLAGLGDPDGFVHRVDQATQRRVAGFAQGLAGRIEDDCQSGNGRDQGGDDVAERLGHCGDLTGDRQQEIDHR